MSTNKIPRVTRRRFLKETGLTLPAAAAAPAISAPFVSRAMADTKSLSIVQWSHFVPEYDKWFDNFAKEWGEKNKISVTVDHIPVQNVAARAAAEVVGRIGPRSVRMERLRRRASLPQIPCRCDEPRRGHREEIRQGQHDRPADRLQPGRQDLVGLSRLLHQLPGHVPQEHVGRDRDEARHLGQYADRRRQAEGEGPPGRHFARPQQRPEHDLARPVVEFWRRHSGRARQENRAQQQGDGRSGQVRRRALQGSDDVGSPVVERLQQQPLSRFGRRLADRQPDLGVSDVPEEPTRKAPTTSSS